MLEELSGRVDKVIQLKGRFGRGSHFGIEILISIVAQTWVTVLPGHWGEWKRKLCCPYLGTQSGMGSRKGLAAIVDENRHYALDFKNT